MKKFPKIFSSISLIFSMVFFSLVLFSCKESPPNYTKSDVTLHKYNWQGEVPEKRKVRLINRYGNITTRNTNQNNIEMAGVIQKVGNQAGHPEIKFTNIEGLLEIEVIYKSPSVDEYKNRTSRIDLGIYIPQGTSLEMITDFGDIKTKKHRSKLIAKTESGKIKLSTHNTAKAVSFSGDISLDILNWKKSKFPVVTKKNQYELFSGQGDIRVYLASDIDLSIEADSGKGICSKDILLGSLTNDFHKLKTKLGNGERELVVSSPSGKIEFFAKNVESTKPSNANSVDIDLTKLPAVPQWKPGDPVVEKEDSREIDLKKAKRKN